MPSPTPRTLLHGHPFPLLLIGRAYRHPTRVTSDPTPPETPRNPTGEENGSSSNAESGLGHAWRLDASNSADLID
jgi:hypothetical protein